MMQDNPFKKKERLIKQLEEMFDSKFQTIYSGPKEAFGYYFSNFDIDGIDKILQDKKYDGVAKDYYLKLIKKTFDDLRKKGIVSLKVIPGICSNCNKGCEGFTFLDKKSGLFVDLIIEISKNEIIDFMECYDLKNEIEFPAKTERIVIKTFEVRF